MDTLSHFPPPNIMPKQAPDNGWLSFVWSLLAGRGCMAGGRIRLYQYFPIILMPNSGPKLVERSQKDNISDTFAVQVWALPEDSNVVPCGVVPYSPKRGCQQKDTTGTTSETRLRLQC